MNTFPLFFQALLNRIEQSSSSSWGFPYKTAILFLILGIWYMVDRDIRVHKGFESGFILHLTRGRKVSLSFFPPESNVGHFLHDFGLDGHAVRAYEASVRFASDARRGADRAVTVMTPLAVKAAEKAKEWAVLGLGYAKVFMGVAAKYFNEGLFKVRHPYPRNTYISLDQ